MWFLSSIYPLDQLLTLDRKARFARVRAARGWGLAYQAFSIDLPHQSQTLDPALKASEAIGTATIRLLDIDYPAGNDFMQVWTNLCYRECFWKTNIWQELQFEFSRLNLNRNVHSPSLCWWLITQLRPIWKKAPPGLQRPSRTDSGISGVLYWPKPSGPHLGPDPRPPIPQK